MSRRNLDSSQTIFALASGPLPSAVAIVRLSGPTAFAIASRVFRSTGFKKERGLWRGDLFDPETSEKIDDSLVLGFVSPHSFTGEDSIEFQCHGSIAVIRALQKVLVSLGARPAERGEFSYRALLNGKLSPSDIENLADTFLARDPAELSRVYRRKDGALLNQIARARDRLIALQAVFDTAVDFSEEYSSVVQTAKPILDEVIRECSAIIHRYEKFSGSLAHPRIVLGGLPNAGKSALFNALLCRYRSLVNESAGTTRDVVEDDVEIGGRTYKLVDTAGIRSAESVIEREGISMGEDYLASSRLWIFVVDGTKGLSQELASLYDRYRRIPHLLVWNKKDLREWVPPSTVFDSLSVISLSAQTGEGLNLLWNALESCLATGASAEPLPTAVQTARLKFAGDQLAGLYGELEGNHPPEYLAEKTRLVIGILEGVVGEVSPDDVLDRIFSEFCIGK